MKAVRNILCGMILGVANVIPGVSGGTMAIILNIYDELLDAISLKKEKIKKNIGFITTIALGGMLGVLLFSNALQYLYHYFNRPTSFFFIGVIIGSIPMISKQALKEGKIKVNQLLPFIIAIGIMGLIAFVGDIDSTKEGWDTLTKAQLIWIIIGAGLSAFAMIIPGISGSFIMLILGIHSTVIDGVSDLNLKILIPVAIGAILGLLLGTKLVKILLSKFRQATYLAILGLVVGSIFILYPGIYLNKEGIISLVLMCVGCIISYIFSEK